MICESCERDLTFTYGPTHHCLKLSDEHINPSGGAVVDVYVLPIIENDLYFCGFGCLSKYVKEKSK
jgi:hypothetical protein